MSTAMSEKPVGAHNNLLLIPFEEAMKPDELYLNRLLLKSQEGRQHKLELVKLRLLEGELILHSTTLPDCVLQQAVYFGVRNQKLCLGIVSASLVGLQTFVQWCTVEKQFVMQHDMNYDFVSELDAFQARLKDFMR